jgi:biopolymer transport protein ExbB
MAGKFTGKYIGIMAVALLVILLGGALRADAWWDAKWQFRKKIAFDTTAKGADLKENITEVPVLLRLHTGNFAFTNAREDGSDLRFVSGDDKTPLKFHIEKYDPKQEIALVWVKAPQISGGSNQDFVWVYYGNSSVQGGSDSGGTYDTAQAAVFHFNEKDGSPRDATAYGNHAADFSGKLGVPAAIGNGVLFNGSSDRLIVKRSPSLNFAKGFTFSTWLKPAATPGDARLFSWDDGKQSLVIGLDQSGVWSRIVTGSGKGAMVKGGPVSAAGWHHLAVTAEPGKKVTIYLDGKESASTPLKDPLPSPADEMAIGGTVTGGNFYAGELDEVKISALPRTATSIALEAGSQGPESKLAAFMPEEAGSGGGDNLTIHLMKVISKSVTLDGWLVIGLCTFMLVLAVYVFVKKFLLLNNIQRDNRDFLEAFKDNHDPLGLTESEEGSYEHSSLYRIYMAGHDEIVKWLSRHAREGDVLEIDRLKPSVINIYRSALDRASVLEAQRLSAWMIVLTLGISGGPFWGLLGTVWGVMNTFASLAEAGEANLSAIAPGVASALACTLFGLLVAIPALFAYSYLNARMKMVSSGNRTFIDELLVKIEDVYGETA